MYVFSGTIGMDSLRSSPSLGVIEAGRGEAKPDPIGDVLSSGRLLLLSREFCSNFA